MHTCRRRVINGVLRNERPACPADAHPRATPQGRSKGEFGITAMLAPCTPVQALEPVATLEQQARCRRSGRAWTISREPVNRDGTTERTKMIESGSSRKLGHQKSPVKTYFCHNSREVAPEDSHSGCGALGQLIAKKRYGFLSRTPTQQLPRVAGSWLFAVRVPP